MKCERAGRWRIRRVPGGPGLGGCHDPDTFTVLNVCKDTRARATFSSTPTDGESHMMDLATIRGMSAERAAVAAQKNLEPLMMDYGDDVERIRGIPYLGDHRPDGWTLLRVFFVDGTGWGQRGEPAYTFEELLDLVVMGRGYAILESGQFQLYIGEFSGPYTQPNRRTSI